MIGSRALFIVVGVCSLLAPARGQFTAAELAERPGDARLVTARAYVLEKGQIIAAGPAPDIFGNSGLLRTAGLA